MRYLLCLVLLLTLAACEPAAPPEHAELPTLASLPSDTAAPPPTETIPPDLNSTQLVELGQTQTAQAATVTERASMALTNDDAVHLTWTAEAQATIDAAALALSVTPPVTVPTEQSAAASSTAGVTVTPSMTITDTPTRTATNTPLPTDDPTRPSNALAEVLLSWTPPPPGTWIFGTLPATISGFATPPPVNTSGALCLPPVGGFGTVYTADAVLAAQIGCSSGGAFPYPAAVQTFERGVMVYVGTTPASIYVLYNTGAYSRFDDTFVDGVDPNSSGEIPPAGMLEPIRGFGKVWRNDPNVRNGLGWAYQPETGTTATVLLFQSGQMIALPPLGQVAVLTGVGTYRLIAGTA